ncbi:hypothetical protein HEP87_64065 [Streptomyces sp. S1D4-11]|nr:hypothetical protein [Streptomyces sp. S1D4-11]
MLCPAVEDLSPGVLAAYRQLPLFDDAGYTLAEVSIALVLERESSARARGARILAEFVSHAAVNDAVSIGRWNSEGEGVERAMRAALAHAKPHPRRADRHLGQRRLPHPRRRPRGPRHR